MLRVGKSKLKALAAAATVAAPAVSMAQVSSTWINPGSQTWSTVTNWQGGLLPDGGGTAVLPATSITDALANIHLNSNRTLGRLDFQGNFTGSKAYAITGGSNLQMNPSATINVDSGTHRITVGNFLSSGELIKTGNGTLVLNSNATFSAAGGITPLLSINGGVVEARGANSLRGISGIATANGSSLDLNNVGNVGSIVLGLGGDTAPNGALRVIGGTNNVTSGFLIVVDTGTVNVGSGFAYSFNGMMFDSNIGTLNGLNKTGAGTFNYQAVGLGMSMQGPLNVTAGAMNMIGPGVATNLNVTGGTFSYAAGSLTAVNPVNVNGGAFVLNAGGSLTGATSVTSGNFIINGGIQNGTVTVGGGTFTMNGGTVNSVVSVNTGTAILNGGRISTLAVNGGNARILQGSPANAAARVVRMNALNLAGGANPTQSLNITNNSMIIDTANTAAGLAAHNLHTDQLEKANNGFAWDQPGITSSVVATDVGNGIPTGIGIVWNNDGGGNAIFYGDGSSLPQFQGQTVNENSILFKYTYIGDSDLNGIVDTVDFSLFQFGFGGAPYNSWAFGDYDYNGVIDTVDFSLFQFGYGSQGAPLSPALAQEIVDFGDANGLDVLPSIAAAAVPEPASIGLASIAALGLLKRRRRA